MNPKMLQLLTALADVLEKYQGGLTYTSNDDGVHATIDGDWKNKVCIEWPSNGNVVLLRDIVDHNTPNNNLCGICKREMKEEENCGGDCVYCMAAAGDPECIKYCIDKAARVKA